MLIKLLIWTRLRPAQDCGLQTCRFQSLEPGHPLTGGARYAQSPATVLHVHAPANLSAISSSSAQVVQITTDSSPDKVVFSSISTRGNGYAQRLYPYFPNKLHKPELVT
jgi:hypothetical protein